jgi:hypothetical protein
MSVAFVRCSDEAPMTINLSIPEQEALGMVKDPATAEWWATQDNRAWQAATANPLPLATALPYIGQWLQWATAGQDWLIWCHGATFDCPLLEELFRRAGVPCPWKFWQVRCTRTLYDLACVNLKDFPYPPPHVALNEAISQTRALNAAFRVLARAHQVDA